MGALADEYILVRADVSRIPRDVQKAGREAGHKFGGAFSGAAKGLLAGAALVGGLTAATGFLKSANAEARESAKVGKVTAQVIKSTGGAAKITSGQVGALATSISNATGKDDELIQSGANLLLTFKNVRNEVGKNNDIFNRATAAAVDLSATGFGSVAGSSKMLGKALNDPVKGITALQRAGVTFSDQQREQIRVMVESGNVLGAQKIIMREVESQVGGVAAASVDASEKYAVSADNFKELVGGAIKPALDTFYNAMASRVFPALSSLVTRLSTDVPAAVKQFRAAFRTGQTEDEGTFLESIALAARDIQTATIPVLQRLGGLLSTQVAPALRQVGDYVRANVLPALKSLGVFVLNTLLPAWLSWYAFLIKQLVPILKQVGGFVVSSVIPALGAVARFIASDVVPGFLSIVETVKGLIRVVAPIISQIVGVIIDKFTEMRPQIMSIWNSVKEIITGVMFVIREVISSVTTIIRMIWDRWGANIKAIVGAVFKAIFKIVSGLMKAVAGVIKLVVALIKGDWKGAWNAIKQIFSGVWQAIKAILVGVLGIIKGIFTGFGGWLKNQWTWLWRTVKTTAREELGIIRTNINTVLGQIRTGFARGVAAIGTAWGRIRDVAKNPVRFVVDTVLDNGLLAAFRSISNLVGFNAGKNFHVSLPGGFAAGGVLPGYTPGRDVHRFVSATGGVLDLSGGEGIARPEIVRAVGTKRWNAANAAARGGRVGDSLRYLGGFASGGVAAATQLGRSMGIGTISTYPGHHPSQALARDFMTSNAGLHERLSSALWANRQALNLWYIISRRRIISMTRPGSGWQPYTRSNPHTDHVHASFYPAALRGVVGALTKAGSIAGAAFAPAVDLGKYMNQIGGAMGRLKEIGGSPFGQMVAGIPKKIVGAVKSKISSLAASFMPSLPGTPGIGDAGNLTGTNRQIGRQMMLAAGFGAQHWPALERLWTGESGWNHRARNPSSGAYGIPQSLPASKMRSAGADYLTNPRTQIAWGLGYIRDRYGTPTGALNFWNSKSPHWYDDGGWLPPGLSLAMNGTGRSERVVPPGGIGSRPVVINIDLGDGVTQRVQGVLDEHDEFRASVGRMR